MLKRTTLLVCTLAFSAGMAFTGVAEAQHRGTKAQEDACKRDVVRHCRRVIDQGDFVILDCLKANARKISRACYRVLEENGQLPPR